MTQDNKDRSLLQGASDILKPLECVGDTLYEGERLQAGQALCYIDLQEGSALEFGLNHDGHFVYWDTSDDHNALIWTNDRVKGSYLELKDGLLELITESSSYMFWKSTTVVWRVGDCEDLQDDDEAPRQLDISEEGLVSFRTTTDAATGSSSSIWSVDSQGTITDGCREKPLEEEEQGGSESSSPKGWIAALVIVVFLVASVWTVSCFWKRKMNKKMQEKVAGDGLEKEQQETRDGEEEARNPAISPVV